MIVLSLGSWSARSGRWCVRERIYHRGRWTPLVRIRRRYTRRPRNAGAIRFRLWFARRQGWLDTLWYEDAYGRRIPDPMPGLMGRPAGAARMVSRSPCEVRETTYRLDGNNGATIESLVTVTWSEDLVLALVQHGGCTLGEAITFATAGCERCLNAACYDLGLTGYRRGGPEWLAARTRCRFCETEGTDLVAELKGVAARRAPAPCAEVAP